MKVHGLVRSVGVLSCAALASACGAKTVPGNCTPKGASASGFTSLSLVNAEPLASSSALHLNVTSTASLSSARSPRMLGGLLRVESLAAGVDAPESVVNSSFSSLSFSRQRDCSSVFEFRKEGDAYFVDSFLNHHCLYPKLIYRGRNPVVQVFRPAADGLLDGFESIPVSLSELEIRNEVLSALDAIAGAGTPQRSVMIHYGFNVERMVHLRGVVANKEKSGEELGLGEALCLAVPQSELDAYNALPADARGDSPMTSSTVRPEDCQILADSQWHTFKVPDAQVASRKPLLDSLVAETIAYKNFVRERSGLSPEVSAKIDDLRLKSAEWFAAERRYRTIRLGIFGVRAANNGCPSGNAKTAADNKIFSGPQRNAYIDLMKKIVPSDVVADLETLKAHTCQNTDPVFTALAAKLGAAISDSDAKAFALAKASRDVQLAMKAQKDRVGIATNHILNHSADSVVVTFKDLAVFPASSPLAPELSRHIFSFEKPWLGMTFDVTKAHPLVNNLRTELNDGYAVTFGGIPVGAVIAKVPQSGGASVIALPRRSRANDANRDGASVQGPSPNSNKRETTTTGEGC